MSGHPLASQSMPAYYRSPEWHALRQQVLERDREICFYCGEKAVTADHVLARGAGGMDDLENLVAACTLCNTIAGGKWFRDRESKRAWVRTQRRKATRANKNERPFDASHYEATMREVRRLGRAPRR